MEVSLARLPKVSSETSEKSLARLPIFVNPKYLRYTFRVRMRIAFESKNCMVVSEMANIGVTVFLFLSPRDWFKSRVIVLCAGQLGHTPALGWQGRAVPHLPSLLWIAYCT